ncbi:nucleoside hydrolase [Schizopora paradoxa]|uniref:Nucleoside hydrolase n=1 Tax=Schizopora paradoxa TaxID=27342 RepID=A0A0H2SFU5_9AGAM|nr:nucleoside hydrolase [Schizopora paradoxa]
MKNIWLDCDPGHDDATAILLAVSAPNVKLLGVSNVHGNSDSNCTFNNAVRCLYAFGADPEVLVHRGAASPLIKHEKHDPEIHGRDGLGGVEGLPSVTDPALKERLESSLRAPRAVEGIANCIRRLIDDGKSKSDSESEKVTIVSTGPMTNIALFVSVYPDLLQHVEQFVFMGGGVGIGNRSAVAEYNILCDPEAAQIVLNAPVKKTMIPLNVTHTAIVTSEIHARLLSPSGSQSTTPLRHTLSTLISFFADSYKSVFGFEGGPPLHDALTIAYVAAPELFRTRRFRVDIELGGHHTSGETVVDLWDYRKAAEDDWGRDGKNCLVAESVDVSRFFDFFVECIERCDAISPLNH